MASKSSKPQPIQVDDYPERPSKDALKSDKQHRQAEGREDQKDQIADYHKKHPTLKAEGPQYDVVSEGDAAASGATG